MISKLDSCEPHRMPDNREEHHQVSSHTAYGPVWLVVMEATCKIQIARCSDDPWQQFNRRLPVTCCYMSIMYTLSPTTMVLHGADGPGAWERSQHWQHAEDTTRSFTQGGRTVNISLTSCIPLGDQEPVIKECRYMINERWWCGLRKVQWNAQTVNPWNRNQTSKVKKRKRHQSKTRGIILNHSYKLCCNNLRCRSTHQNKRCCITCCIHTLSLIAAQGWSIQ